MVDYESEAKYCWMLQFNERLLFEIVCRRYNLSVRSGEHAAVFSKIV